MRPITCSIKSLPVTHGRSVPVKRKRIVRGTSSQVWPVARMAAMSVEPMPVAKQPSAPAMHACELPPAISSPGNVLPISMPSALWMAALPISYSGISRRPVRPRMFFRTVAVWMLCAGEFTIEVTNTRLVSQTFSPCSSSRPIVSGEPRSSDQV